MTISKEILDELLKGVERPEDLLGDAGLMKELKIKLMERMLGAELTTHLGYEDGESAPPSQSNRRNGTSSKVLKGQDGELPVAIPGGVSRSCLFALCSDASVRYAEASATPGDPPCPASIRPNSAACLPA